MAFTATARIPTRPLSYENRDIAMPKEFIVDYTTGLLYLKNENGDIIDITLAIREAIYNSISTDTDFADKIIVIIDGEEVTLNDAIVKLLTEIDEIRNALGMVIDPTTGAITINLSATQVVETEDKQFVSQTDKEEYAEKIKLVKHDVTLYTEDTDTIRWVMLSEGTLNLPPVTSGIPPSSSETYDYWMAVVTLDYIKSTDIPFVTIKLNDFYSTAMSELESYANIYKILTYDGYIEIRCTEMPTTTLNLQLLIPTTSDVSPFGTI